MNESLYDFCRRNGRSGLLDQWDTERNGADTPRTVSYGSQRKIWWRCEKGHTWQAPVYSRTGGAGCPYCAGRRVGQGNDLASLYPALAAQWDLRKNAPRKPSDVLAGSHSPAWWLCEKGHSWQASVNSRLSGLCGAAGGAWGKFSGRCRARAGGPMGHGAERPPDAPAGDGGDHAQGLVEVRLGPLLASRRFPTGAEGGGLSLLCGAEGPSRLQRPCLQVDRRGGPVAPDPQREPDTGNGNGQQPPQGLVAVSPGPCMEGSGLLPHGGAEMRLSGLRRLPGRGPQGPV